MVPPLAAGRSAISAAWDTLAQVQSCTAEKTTKASIAISDLADISILPGKYFIAALLPSGFRQGIDLDQCRSSGVSPGEVASTRPREAAYRSRWEGNIL